MARAATAFVDFEGDFSKVGRNAGAQSKKLEGTFNSSFKRIATFAAGALATIGVGKVLKDAFKQAEEAQKVGKLTNAVLKSTGGIAKVSAKQVESMSNSLSALSGVDDEIIQSGENVLLTFTNIKNEAGKGNDVFNQATEAALNLSQALGQDMQSSVIQLGKALNDPIKGVTALQRVGVSFTKQQKEQIKTLVDSGKTLDAQKLILAELTKEFGGAAAAAATPSQKLGVAFKNIEESIGGLVLPIFEKLASFITVTAAPALQRLIDVTKTLGGVAKVAFEIGFGGKSIAGVHGWLAIFSKLGAVLRGFVDFIRGDVVHAGIDFGRAFGLDDQSPTITKTIKVLATIRKAIGTVVEFIKHNWKPILVAAGAALLIFTAPIVAVVAGLILLYVRFKLVREGLARFVEFFKRNWPTIQAVGTAVVGALIAAIKPLIPILIDVGRGIAAVIGFLRQNKDVAIALAAVLGTLVAGFTALLIIKKIQVLIEAFRISIFVLNATLLANPIILVIAALVALGAAVVLAYRHFGPFHDAVDKVWQILQSTFHWVQHNWPLLLAILTGPFGLAVRFIIQHWSGILSFFKGIPGAIAGFFKNVATIITAPYRAAFSAIARLWNATIGKLHFKIPSWVPGIGGKGFDVPDIPTFAGGGIFNGNGAGLALLHSGEGVFTPDQMNAMGNSGIDARTIVQGNVYGDSHLRRIFEDHDQKLHSELAVGVR